MFKRKRPKSLKPSAPELPVAGEDSVEIAASTSSLSQLVTDIDIDSDRMSASDESSDFEPVEELSEDNFEDDDDDFESLDQDNPLADPNMDDDDEGGYF